MLNRKGQSTLEYALIIAVVVAGLLLMQYYVKRGYAGRLKTASDDMGEQYDPTVYSGYFNTVQSSRVAQTVLDRTSRTEHLDAQISTKIGNETVNAWTENENLYKQ